MCGNSTMFRIGLSSWIYIASLFCITSLQQIYADRKNIATESTTANFPILTLIMPTWFIIYHSKRIFCNSCAMIFFFFYKEWLLPHSITLLMANAVCFITHSLPNYCVSKQTLYMESWERNIWFRPSFRGEGTDTKPD